MKQYYCKDCYSPVITNKDYVSTGYFASCQCCDNDYYEFELLNDLPELDEEFLNNLSNYLCNQVGDSGTLDYFLRNINILEIKLKGGKNDKKTII